MSKQSKRQAAVVAAAFAAPMILAACETPGERAVSGAAIGAGAGGAIGSLSGNFGRGALIGGAVGAVGGAVTAPFRPSSYNNWGYTDASGVYHRYDRFGYYDANGTYIPYANARGAYCAKWDPLTNTCVWWLTG